MTTRDANKVSKSIQDKHLEVHYNEKKIRTREGKIVAINLQGKIKCPVLNQAISSIVCSKLMDKEGWPRFVDQAICKKCNCFVHLSIRRFSEQKKKKE